MALLPLFKVHQVMQHSGSIVSIRCGLPASIESSLVNVAMQSSSSPEPTIADVLNQLRDFKADVDQRFEKIDQRFEKIDQRFEKIDQRFEKIDQRFEKIDQRFESLDYKFDTYQNASDKLVRLATTIIVAAATVAVLPSAFEAFGPLLTQILLNNQ